MRLTKIQKRRRFYFRLYEPRPIFFKYKNKRNTWTVIMLLSLLVMAAARPQEFDDDEDRHEADDKKDDPARVQIKVYRGPTKNDGYAPWGFWVKQPSDEE